MSRRAASVWQPVPRDAYIIVVSVYHVQVGIFSSEYSYMVPTTLLDPSLFALNFSRTVHPRMQRIDSDGRVPDARLYAWLGLQRRAAFAAVGRKADAFVFSLRGAFYDFEYVR